MTLENNHAANAANIARIELIARDAETKAVEFRQRGSLIDAAHYTGMRDGLLRAVSVLKGNG